MAISEMKNPLLRRLVVIAAVPTLGLVAMLASAFAGIALEAPGVWQAIKNAWHGVDVAEPEFAWEDGK